jgi:endonuclease YncB( thermonuclease family)
VWWPPSGYGPPSPRRVVGVLLAARLVPVMIIMAAVGALLLVSLAGSLLEVGRSPILRTTAAPSRQVVTVTEVLDGDTIATRELDRPVQLAGIDAPGGPCGRAAGAVLARRLRPGLTVTLVWPSGAGAGPAAEVWATDGTDLGRELVRRGLARARPGAAAPLQAAQRAARADRAGLWGRCR